jgi:hypothetical protein
VWLGAKIRIEKLKRNFGVQIRKAALAAAFDQWRNNRYAGDGCPGASPGVRDGSGFSTCCTPPSLPEGILMGGRLSCMSANS